jgi:hypothetical protein
MAHAADDAAPRGGAEHVVGEQRVRRGRIAGEADGRQHLDSARCRSRCCIAQRCAVERRGIGHVAVVLRGLLGEAKPSGATRNAARAVAGTEVRRSITREGQECVDVARDHATAFPAFGQRQRLFDQRPVGTGLVRAFAQHLAERATARLSMEQAQHVAGDVLERTPSRQLRLDIGAQRAQQVAARLQARRRTRRHRVRAARRASWYAARPSIAPST